MDCVPPPEISENFEKKLQKINRKLTISCLKVLILIIIKYTQY